MRQLAALGYGAVTTLRNRAYDAGVFRSTHPGIPVIAVGNISAGGTGKTPLVSAIAGRLVARGLRAAVVTRGYRRSTRGTFVVADGAGGIASAREGGDEPVMMARRTPGLVVIADEVRVRGCRVAAERFGADVALLDDGFQHRACARDLDIVVIDATAPPWTDRMLPWGRLREPACNLSRADAIVVSRCNQAADWQATVARLHAEQTAPVFPAMFEATGMVSHPGASTFDLEGVRGATVVSFCGIGSPLSFRTTLESLGVNVVDALVYHDHHRYSAQDIDEILARQQRCGAAHIVTTEKDVQRLEEHAACFRGVSLLHPVMEVRLGGLSAVFDTLVDGVLTRGGRV